MKFCDCFDTNCFRENNLCQQNKALNKIDLIMRLVIFLIVIGCLPVNGRELYAQKINLSLKNATLPTVFKEIEGQSNYNFVYTREHISSMKPISITVQNADINTVLSMIFKNQSFLYTISGNYIVIKEKSIANIENEINLSVIESTNESPPDYVVTGIVNDENGMPLEGATVSENGTNSKAKTNNKGEFRIRVKDGKASLGISFIGYSRIELFLDGKKEILVSLIPITKSIEEVVVIGYDRTIRKKDLTIAAAKVNMTELQKAPVVSFEDALAGRVAGVTIVSPDGQPGSASNIVIRGNNSVTQDNSPLYVIDGFPIENPDNNMLNPAEIESMEILKDASATAIYGARGANGVILITTKKGKLGAPIIEFQAHRSTQNITKRIPLMNPYEYVQYIYELNPTNTLLTLLKPTGGDTSLVTQVMNKYKNVKGVDLQDKVFGAPAPFINGYLAVRGGNEKTKYNFSGNYANQEGIMINSGFKRYQLKINVDQTLTPKVRMGLNSTFTYTNQYGVSPTGSGTSGLSGGTSYLMSSVWGYIPVPYTGNFDSLNINLDNPNWDLASTTGVYNPLTNSKNEYHKNDNYNLVSNLYLDYQVISGLKFRVSAGFSQTNTVKEDFYNSLTSKGRISPTNPNGVNGSFNNHTNVNFTNENTLTYNKTIARKHHLNILTGLTEQDTKSFSKGGSATNIPNESLGINGLGQGVPGIYTTTASENTLVSVLGRVQYDYDTRYLVSASYRADGSSKFSQENRWAYFPSFSAAWRITKESFMEKLSPLMDLKLRVGYGLTGNNRVSDYVTYSSLNNPYLSVNNTFTPFTNFSSLGNKYLKWETTKQSNIGIDADFLDGKMEVSIDYYNKVTSDLILNTSLPGSAGLPNVYMNIGKIQNRGLEISLSTVNIKTSKFTWTSNFNISFNQNKVLALGVNEEEKYGTVAWNGNYNSSPLYIAKVGQPLGQMFGYLSDGVYQYADYDKSPTGTYTLKGNIPTSYPSRTTLPTPGSVKLKDLNGDGVITAADRTVIGRGNPIHFGGINNNFTFYNFDVSVLLQWSFGNDIYNANRLIFENGSPNNPYSSLNMYKSYVNRWSPTNQTNDMPKANSSNPGSYYWSRCVEDGSYLRVKTVSIGYNLSNKLIKRLKAFKNFRVYFASQNLITWTKYSGFDPEVNARPSALTPGFDFSVYPRAKTITFGANITF